jgi:hypothetical protein
MSFRYLTWQWAGIPVITVECSAAMAQCRWPAGGVAGIAFHPVVRRRSSVGLFFALTSAPGESSRFRSTFTTPGYSTVVFGGVM